ncbi:DNA transfer protein [Salmonella enterica]|uniref:DNA injection protein n=4 Tax=Salmonella enterica TaxID=28901 RepID=A0A8D4Y2L8_SALET|nr:MULTISPECIES: DNA transfer protein [Salmonella]EBH8255846.1 acyltransferase [Salmonella enterica subsp. enterica serovar Typhimurium str. UK-1]EBR0442081.1 acyltransferase [Salmonella enterica subsp. enterica serovar Haifa]EBS1932845.1 acyltransferase [Salmonella enterica subsp. enterica serovar Saintpaul]EBY0629070.1 acyltransferase [Salmonella enterica subsp. enterica serovar Coeln]EDT2610578.1 acyltransferase [Salmonella enterica subsp. enterica serovar 4,12:i:-]EDU8259081.1 acyltransfe
MATWQQGINSGGFLAGIGAQNENAPKASDINATLGLIRENNDLARSGANNVALTGLRGMAGVADIYKQEQQQKALNAFNQVHANAWATGDPSGLFKFAQENPAFVAQAQQAFSGLNEQQRNDMGDLAMKANVALSQGPESYSKFITDNKDRLNRVGANPDWMIQTGVQNPEQLSHMLTTMSLGALGPEKAFAVQDKMVGREIDRGRLAETIRSNQAGEALQQRGQNISAKNAELSREIQRAELQDKVLDRQIARETNQIKLDELKQKQADVRQKAEIARADRQAAAQGAVDTFSTALDSLNEIEQSPGLSKAVGIRSAFPTVPGSDAANFEARLDTFKAQTFLPMVQSLKGMGALSDAEGKKLSDAVGALSPKMSEKAFRESIGKIRNQLESKLSTVKKQFDYQEPVQNMPGKQSPAGSNFSSLWGD